MCVRGWEAYVEKWPGSKIHLKVTSFSLNALELQMQLERGFPGDAVFRGSCLGLLGNCKPWPTPPRTSRGLQIRSFFFFFKLGPKFT